MTFDLPYVGNGPGQFSMIPPLLPYKVGEWVLLDDLIYTDRAGKQHNTPKYFITDLASIPWIAQPIFSTVDTRIEGVGHDWLYCSNALPRARCDALLREMLIATGCDTARAELIYAGVRVGGDSRYRACTGGPKREDFAWEYMSPSEVRLYESATSWLAFTSETGLPDLYCRFNVDAWGIPVSVTSKAWITTGASEMLFSLHWVF